MATSKITWENKEGIQNDESVARKNKVMDNDMNEIKQVVNNNADELSTAQSNIENLQSGQGTANTDITNLKSRVSTLETDNTTNKSNIQQLQNNQQETETNVETLQEKVTTLETDNIQNKSDINALKTDNETNKSNISTLQEEQETQNTNIENLQENDTTQDELIEKLQQENNNIKSALINVETEQAKSLHIEDASTVSAQLSVEGNAEQETRSGKNLFDKDNVNSIKAECNATDMKVTTSNQNSYYIECDPNTTYTLSKTIGTFNRVWSMQEIPEIGKSITVTNNDTSNNIATITTGENDKYLCFYPLLSTEVSSGITYESVLDTIQIEKSSSATEYEAYGASPSPNYPSKVKCLGSNKNELNIEEIESNSNTNVINNQNGILELQGIEGYYKGVYIEKQLKPKTTYTICANLTEVSNNARGRIGIGTEVSYNNASIATLDFDVATGKKEINFTTNETGIVYIMFVCNWRGNSGHVKYENIKLEEGTEATSYSPYRTR